MECCAYSAFICIINAYMDINFQMFFWMHGNGREKKLEKGCCLHFLISLKLSVHLAKWLKGTICIHINAKYFLNIMNNLPKENWQSLILVCSLMCLDNLMFYFIPLEVLCKCLMCKGHLWHFKSKSKKMTTRERSFALA